MYNGLAHGECSDRQLHKAKRLILIQLVTFYTTSVHYRIDKSQSVVFFRSHMNQICVLVLDLFTISFNIILPLNGSFTKMVSISGLPTESLYECISTVCSLNKLRTCGPACLDTLCVISWWLQIRNSSLSLCDLIYFPRTRRLSGPGVSCRTLNVRQCHTGTVLLSAWALRPLDVLIISLLVYLHKGDS